MRQKKDFFEFLRWFFTMSPRADGMQIQWCYLENEKDRYFGFKKDWFDGPFYCFGFWFYQIVLEPLGSNMYFVHHHRKALEEAVKVNPEIHLLSDNKIVRELAENYLKRNK